MIEIILSVLAFLVVSFVSWVIVAGWFFAYARASELYYQGVQFKWTVKWPIYIFLAIGIVFDVLFNWTCGIIIFREIPKELFFTDRVKRHYTSSNTWRQAKAVEWATAINKIYPGHI